MAATIIEKQTGKAFLLHTGDSIEITDIEGKQVADVFAVAKCDSLEVFSPGVTMMINRSIKPGKWYVLYSNLYRPMLTITKDDVEAHDMLVPCCRKESYARMHSGGQHPNCLDNMNSAFAEFSITPFSSLQPLSLFLDVSVDSEQRMRYAAPRSQAGDSVMFRAEMDVIVGVTACSDDVSTCNNGLCKPVRADVTRALSTEFVCCSHHS